MTMFGGFIKVMYYTGLVIAILIVLCVIGMVNQHDQVSMKAVVDGLGDLFKWVGELLGEGVKHI